MSTLAEPPAPHRSGHPAIAGRERELAALAGEARRLGHLLVTCDLPADEAAELTAALRTVNERLGAFVPEGPHPRIWQSEGKVAGGTASMMEAMPYDVVVGPYNPLSPPLTIDIRPPRAYATARFGPAHEGAPGWVHGAVIAGAFDIVLTAANHLENAAGPTTRLDIRYRRPTLLDEEAQFEAWVERRSGKRVVSRGQLLQDGVVKVEAEGEFVALDRTRVGVQPPERPSQAPAS